MNAAVLRRALAIAIALVPLPSAAAGAPPDLTGTWMLAGDQAGFFSAEPPVLTASGAALYRQRQSAIAASQSADPLRACLSPGVPRAMYLPLPIQIVQDARQIVILHSISQRVRRIAIDGRTPDERMIRDFGPLYNGYSTGRRDGDDWVVETVALDPTTWLDGSGVPKSAHAKVVERLRRSGRTLLIETTIIDPEMLARPWTTRKTYHRVPDSMMRDDNCIAERARDTRWYDGASRLRRSRDR